MFFNTVTNSIYGVSYQIASFENGDGVVEQHFMIPIPKAIDYLNKGVIPALLNEIVGGNSEDTVLYVRAFCKNIEIEDDLRTEILSVADICLAIGQPPLSGVDIVLWVVKKSSPNKDDGIEKTIFHDASSGIIIKHGGYIHFWCYGQNDSVNDSEKQTDLIFKDLLTILEKNNLSLKDNCIRTWILVDDIDNNYLGMVKARNDCFAANGLTKDNHFISSTGINCQHRQGTKVTMESYSIGGITPEQITFLKGYSHLNPTYEYGVSFERGTVLTFGDRKHVYISGTASINNRGEVMWIGNLNKQVERAFENVAVLLEEAGCEFTDIAQMIIYLRDPDGYAIVEEYMSRFYPYIPKVIVNAPVCRKDWLVEIECMAIKACHESRYATL